MNKYVALFMIRTPPRTTRVTLSCVLSFLHSEMHVVAKKSSSQSAQLTPILSNQKKTLLILNGLMIDLVGHLVEVLMVPPLLPWLTSTRHFSISTVLVVMIARFLSLRSSMTISSGREMIMNGALVFSPSSTSMEMSLHLAKALEYICREKPVNDVVVDDGQ